MEVTNTILAMPYNIFFYLKPFYETLSTYIKVINYLIIVLDLFTLKY